MKRTFLLLASLVLLAACKTEKPAETSSSTTSKPKTSRTSSSTSSQTTSSSSTSSSSSEEVVADTPLTIVPMNVDQISHGDYTSIMGTWRNGAGHELTFHATGLASTDAEMGEYGDFSSGVFTIGVHAPTGGFALLMIPAGQTIPQGQFAEGGDSSDSSKDRLVGTQSLLSESSLDPYYRVKTTASLQADTGVSLSADQTMLDYVIPIMGDKGWSMVEDNFNRSQLNAHATLQASDGNRVQVYANGLILNQEGQLIYIP